MSFQKTALAATFEVKAVLSKRFKLLPGSEYLQSRKANADFFCPKLRQALQLFFRNGTEFGQFLLKSFYNSQNKQLV